MQRHRHGKLEPTPAEPDAALEIYYTRAYMHVLKCCAFCAPLPRWKSFLRGRHHTGGSTMKTDTAMTSAPADGPNARRLVRRLGFKQEHRCRRWTRCGAPVVGPLDCR